MRLMPKQFRYTLTYRNADYELENAPSGWDSETIGNLSRSREFYGMSRKFSLPLRFVNDGAAILREAKILDGAEAGVLLRVEERQNLWNYKTRFYGELDMSTYENDGINVSVSVMESGITANIKARQTTPYEFELVGDDVVNMILPGVRFTDALLWSFSPTIQQNLNVQKKYIPALDMITQSKSGFVSGANVYQTNSGDGSDFSGHTFIRNNRNNVVSVRIFGFVKGYVQNQAATVSNVDVEMGIFNLDNGLSVYNLVYITDNWTPLQVRQYNKEIDFTISLQPGQALYINNRTGTSSGTSVTNVIQEGELRAEYTSVSDDSNCKGIRPFDLFKRLMNRVSPGTPLNSALLSTTWKDLIITSGSAIRELSDAKIKISLKDFYQSFRGIDDVGMGSENGVFRMETLPFFFRNVPMMDVGNVVSCVHTVAEDWIYSKINVGYKSKTTDEPDGREGFNAGQVWQAPFTRTDNEFDLVSLFITDQYEIEKMRVQFNVKKEAKSDANSDNDTFAVHCNSINSSGNFTPILGSQLEDVTGLTYPLTAYNLFISPKRNLLRHGRYLSSMLDLLGSRYIEFASAEKNADISSTNDGIIVEENKSIRVSDLGAKMFRPDIFAINAKLPPDAMDRLDANPFGTISFNFNGTKCSGFVLEAGVDLAGNSAQELTLLAAPDSLLP